MTTSTSYQAACQSVVLQNSRHFALAPATISGLRSFIGYAMPCSLSSLTVVAGMANPMWVSISRLRERDQKSSQGRFKFLAG